MARCHFGRRPLGTEDGRVTHWQWPVYYYHNGGWRRSRRAARFNRGPTWGLAVSAFSRRKRLCADRKRHARCFRILPADSRPTDLGGSRMAQAGPLPMPMLNPGHFECVNGALVISTHLDALSHSQSCWILPKRKNSAARERRVQSRHGIDTLRVNRSVQSSRK